jgi:hypothetical protein
MEDDYIYKKRGAVVHHDSDANGTVNNLSQGEQIAIQLLTTFGVPTKDAISLVQGNGPITELGDFLFETSGPILPGAGAVNI